MAKKKCDKNEIIVRYGWVEEVGNYCLFEGDKLVEPIQQLQVLHLKGMDLAETLQMIFFQRNGGINPYIGLDDEFNLELAKAWNVY